MGKDFYAPFQNIWPNMYFACFIWQNKLDTLETSAWSLAGRWVCVFVQSEPTHQGVRAQIWFWVVLCSHVRQQPLTPLYHLTGPNSQYRYIWRALLIKMFCAQTLNLLYSPVKQCKLPDQSLMAQFGVVFLLCVVNFCKLPLQILKIIM